MKDYISIIETVEGWYLVIGKWNDIKNVWIDITEQQGREIATKNNLNIDYIPF